MYATTSSCVVCDPCARAVHLGGKRQHTPRRLVPGKLGRPGHTSGSELRAQRCIGADPRDRTGPSRHVVRIHQHRGIPGYLSQRARCGCDHRGPAGHRLEHRKAEPLIHRGNHDGQRRRIQHGKPARFHETQKAHAAGDALRLGLPRQDRPVARIPVPHDGQRLLAGNPGQGLQQPGHVLVRTEIPHREEVGV